MNPLLCGAVLEAACFPWTSEILAGSITHGRCMLQIDQLVSTHGVGQDCAQRYLAAANDDLATAHRLLQTSRVSGGCHFMRTPQVPNLMLVLHLFGCSHHVCLLLFPMYLPHSK